MPWLKRRIVPTSHYPPLRIALANAAERSILHGPGGPLAASRRHVALACAVKSPAPMRPRPAIVRPLGHARRDAERELQRAPRCNCCISPRVHLTTYIGSILFSDDTPATLRRALPAAERERWSERLLAAFILLFGRPRERLFAEH
jgi:hypothetical protein